MQKKVRFWRSFLRFSYFSLAFEGVEFGGEGGNLAFEHVFGSMVLVRCKYGSIRFDLWCTFGSLLVHLWSTYGRPMGDLWATFGKSRIKKGAKKGRKSKEKRDNGFRFQVSGFKSQTISGLTTGAPNKDYRHRMPG